MISLTLLLILSAFNVISLLGLINTRLNENADISVKRANIRIIHFICWRVISWYFRFNKKEKSKNNVINRFVFVIGVGNRSSTIFFLLLCFFLLCFYFFIFSVIFIYCINYKKSLYKNRTCLENHTQHIRIPKFIWR